MFKSSFLRLSALRAVAIGSALAFSGLVAHAADLTVVVDSVRSAKGTVRLELDASVAQWDNTERSYAKGDVAASAGSVSFTFKDLAPGSYALGVFHDENDNGMLDMNLIGIPKEGYGFSNNPSPMRKPKFDEARFELPTTGKSITVHLKNW
jgi:uncharacterized protein (DUF2141 family)